MISCTIALCLIFNNNPSHIAAANTPVAVKLDDKNQQYGWKVNCKDENGKAQTVHVTARNATDAEEQVRHDHPNWEIEDAVRDN
jgi:hypothetical protein